MTSKPIVTFAIYLVVLDFAGYWYHRWQHKFGIWWELHAVHHASARCRWCDDRNHVLDDVIQSCFFAAIALVIGVTPSQFVVTAFTNFMQSIQHTNARLPFGWLGERLLVSRSSTAATTRSAMATKARSTAATSACCSRGGT